MSKIDLNKLDSHSSKIRMNIRNFMLPHTHGELLREIEILEERHVKRPWPTKDFEVSCIRELIDELEYR